MRLTTNVRVHLYGDSESGSYAELLLEIGNGRIPTGPEDGLINVPCGTVVQSPNELIQAVFPQLQERYKDTAWLGERAILAPRNDAVNQINVTMLQLIPENEKVYLAVDTTMKPGDAVNYPTEVLNFLNPPGLPAYTLALKVGAPIMLLRNIDASKLCNGTKFTVTRLCPNVIEVTICTGQYEGECIYSAHSPNSFRLHHPVPNTSVSREAFICNDDQQIARTNAENGRPQSSDKMLCTRPILRRLLSRRNFQNSKFSLPRSRLAPPSS